MQMPVYSRMAQEARDQLRRGPRTRTGLGNHYVYSELAQVERAALRRGPRTRDGLRGLGDASTGSRVFGGVVGAFAGVGAYAVATMVTEKQAKGTFLIAAGFAAAGALIGATGMP